MKWDSYLSLLGPTVPRHPLSVSVFAPLTTAIGMMGALPALGLWTNSSHVWTISQKWSLNLIWLATYPMRPCLGMGKTLASNSLGIYFRLLLYWFVILIIYFDISHNIWLRCRRICTFLQWVVDRVIPMTVAPWWCCLDWAQTLTICKHFVPQVMDNKANRK